MLKNEGVDITHEILQQAVLDGRRTKPGIFAVENKTSGKRLIVAAKNVSKRLHDQACYLKQRRHHCPLLDAELQSLGPEGFRFVLLELLDDPDQLRCLKRLHVEDARRNHGAYNAVPPVHQHVNVVLSEKLVNSRTQDLLNFLKRNQAPRGSVQDEALRVKDLLSDARRTLCGIRGS